MALSVATASAGAADDAKNVVSTNANSEAGDAPRTASTNAYPAAAAKAVPTAAANGGKPAVMDYSSFRVVAERNIFNADRTRRTGRGPGRGGERTRPAQVSTISLVGYLGSTQGDRAFFDGSSSLYRKALKTGDSLGEFKLTAISAQGVCLEIGERKLSLKIGEQLRREDNGPWEPAGSQSSAAASTNSSPAGAGTGSSDGESVIAPGDGSAPAGGPDAASTESAGADDVLQRLLKKRQQEENK